MDNFLAMERKGRDESIGYRRRRPRTCDLLETGPEPQGEGALLRAGKCGNRGDCQVRGHRRDGF